MTWYYVPYISAPVTEGSSWPSETPPSPWLTLSGMPTQRPLSWRGWQRRGWIRLLSGLTSPRSTVDRGVAEWISSLPDSPASRSARRGSGWVLTTTVGSGPTSPGSSATWNPSTCSWRTSQELFEQDLPMSSVTLPTSGSMRNGVCTPRPTLVPRTDANGSGLWGTPVARDDQKSPKAHMAMKARMDRNTATSLTVQAKMWGTPRASDCGTRVGPDPHQRQGRRAHVEVAGHQFPPRPDDLDGWQRWEGAQPAIRRGADGSTEWLADALHLGGNGLVPQCAAEAWRQLTERGGWA